MSPNRSAIKTTETSLEIVDAVRRLDGATMDQLAEDLGLASSTVHRHLSTLYDHSYVTKTGDTYEIGLQFLTMGGYAQRRFAGYPMIKNKVDYLATETGERAQFIVEEHGERVYLYTNVGESAVQTGAHIGKRGEIHTSAAGKAILSQLPERRVRQIIKRRGLSAGGPNAVTNAEEFFDELETIRDRKYAFNREETTAGVHAVGAPVMDPRGDVLGALSVSGPANRVKGQRLEEDIPELILGAANELELSIEHS